MKAAEIAAVRRLETQLHRATEHRLAQPSTGRQALQESGEEGEGRPGPDSPATCLLRQPGGFAGFVFLAVQVDLDPRYQTVLVKGPNGPSDDVQLDPAGRPLGHDELPPQDRPACDDNGFKCFDHLLLKRVWLHPASQALGAPVRRLIPWRDEHDVAMDQREGTVEILAAAAYGFEPAAHDLQVLLRHRPLSIPRAGSRCQGHPAETAGWLSSEKAHSGSWLPFGRRRTAARTAADSPQSRS